MAKIRNYDSFGDAFPHFCPDKREIGHGYFTFIGAMCRLPAWLRLAGNELC